jgi:hypothetical protein
MSVKPNTVSLYSLERVLAAAAAAICLILSTVIWLAVRQHQEMWPLQALYLLEMPAASLVGLFGIFQGAGPGGLLAWAVAGALVGFCILGALSVGIFYLPVAALLGVAALWLDRQTWQRLPLHLRIALMAAVAQAALMLALIRVLYPSAV